MTNYKKWLILAPISLILTGAGLSFAIEAGFEKHSQTSSEWIVYGTIALVVFNSGLCLLAQSVIYRIRHERLKDSNRP